MREVFLTLLGWFTFSLLLLALWVATVAIYRWRHRRSLRRRYKSAACPPWSDINAIRREADRLNTSSAGVANREGIDRSRCATGIAVALDRPQAGSPSAGTQGARSSRDSGRVKPFIEDRRIAP